MATIGRILIPASAPSTSFPLRTDFPHGMTLGRTVVAHTFADGSEQRFFLGNPATRYTFIRRTLARPARATLAAFWQATQGGVLPFSYDVPQQDQSFVTKTVRFEDAPSVAGRSDERHHDRGPDVRRGSRSRRRAGVCDQRDRHAVSRWPPCVGAVAPKSRRSSRWFTSAFWIPRCRISTSRTGW